jgi:hypothetical protein
MTMTDYHPGTLNTAGGGSTPASFAASAAGLMEQKLHDLVAAMTGRAPFDMSVDDADARARRVMFVAIAEAVFEHLRDNAGALVLSTEGADAHSHAVTVQVSEP